MTEQSNAAAERSAHVERGPVARAVDGNLLLEVSPGQFKLAAIVRLERKLATAVALATELTDSLEEEVRANYGMANGQVSLHPVEQRRFNRDMAEVTVARAKIALLQGGPE